MWTAVQNSINEFVMMWVLIDPIGTIPVFLAVTAHARAQRRAIAFRSVGIAALILLFFTVGGKILLQALGIQLTSFQIAGGIVLFLFALTMVFGPPKAETDLEEAESVEKATSVAVYPLAVPSIAGPGAMLGAVLLTDTAGFDPMDDLLNIAVTGIVLVATLVLLLSADRIHKVIGDSGVNVLSRVMGLILAAVAVDTVIVAVSQHFHIGAAQAVGL
ncbi:MAG TPA: MarC family protein [Bauldia sp.]|nr:MarC family protein [Bauldia sp.]